MLNSLLMEDRHTKRGARRGGSYCVTKAIIKVNLGFDGNPLEE